MPSLTVVGICSYHAAVHRWLRSLRAHFDGPCLLYLTDPAPGLGEDLEAKYGISVIGVQSDGDFWNRKPTGTYCKQWLCLQEACQLRIRDGFVLRTDVWDVVFQDDPRKYLHETSADIFIAHEGSRLNEEPDNRIWLKDWVSLFGDTPTINSGMICGPRRAVAVLAALVARCPLETAIDQTELAVLANALPGAFVYQRGFLECLYTAFAERGAVVDGKVCERDTGRPWCVVHGNGGRVKPLFEELFPL
jgi:hypothetical protein